MIEIPNWCSNRLIVRGNVNRVQEFDNAFKGRLALFPPQEYELRGRSFEEVFEEKKKEWAKTKLDYCFNALYPVPSKFLEIGYSASKPENQGLEDRLEDLFNPQKSYDGYSWSVSHWGTKWDVYGDVHFNEVADGVVEVVEYEFDTAWSPPCPWVEKVCADWPDLEFELLFYETGMGFAGRFSCGGGRVVEDQNFEHEDMQSFVIEEFGFDPYEGCEEDE